MDIKKVMEMTERDSKTEIKDSLQTTMTTELKLTTEVNFSSETNLSRETNPTLLVLKVEPENGYDTCEMGIKTEEPYLMERTIEIKCKSETIYSSDIQLKSESTSVDSGSDIFKDYNEIDCKVEIKNEPGCFEGTQSESEEIFLKDTNLYSEVEDNISEKTLLTESLRMNTEQGFSCESGGSVLGLDNDFLKVRENSNEEGNSKTYQCKYCEKSFTRAANLNEHHLIHEGKKVHRCNECGKTFTRAAHLKVHSSVHNGERLHTCEICHKTFTWATALRRHVLTHMEFKAHKCEICEKGFIDASTLKRHLQIHEGKRPHHCGKCGRSFTRASNLKSHILTHADKKPHQCLLCEKSYTQASSLKIHVLTHNRKLHKCDICGRSFTTMNVLIQHRQKHPNTS